MLPSKASERKDKTMFFARLPLIVTTALLSLVAADGRAASLASADTTNVAAPADAARPGKAKAQGRVGGLCEALACTDAQAAEIAALRTSLHERNAAGKADREAAQRELASMVRSGKLDAAKVEALLAKRHEAQRDRDAAMAKGLVELNAMLDPTQRTKLAAMIESRGMRAVFGGHGGGGKGKHGKRDAATRGKGPTGTAKAVSTGAGKASKGTQGTKGKQKRARRFAQ